MQYQQGETLEARVATIRRLARWASVAIRSWETLEASIKEGSASSDTLGTFYPYLVVSAHGHRELGILYLYALFERRTDTVNIVSICNHLRKHGVDVDSIDSDIRAHEVPLRKLYEIRGSAIGHRTETRSYDETFAKVRMTKGELDDLVAVAGRCAQALAEVTGTPAEPEMADPVEYLDSMLKTLVDSETQRRIADLWS